MRALLIASAILASAQAQADEITVRVTGLFAKSREADLRRAVEKMERLTIKSIDFEMAHVTFAYEPGEEPFKVGAEQEAVLHAIDRQLLDASNRTMSALPPAAIARDNLRRVEIGVVGLDCQACGYAAYRAVFQIEGVVRATASFKAGLVTAWIDPQQTDREALVAALEKRGVTLQKPETN